MYVADLEVSAAFYRRVFGFETLTESDRLVALDVAGRSVLLLFKQGATASPFETPGGLIPSHGATGPSHFAFAIACSDVPAWQQHLASEGIGLESVVTWNNNTWPTGALSLYLRDPDGHLVELLTPGFWRIY